MIVYEVNLFVQRGIEAGYRHWLDSHVREILALPGFIDAQVFDVLEPETAADEIALCVQYRLQDEAALAHYLDEHAPRLRDAGRLRFGTGFRALRRVLRAITEY